MRHRSTAVAAWLIPVVACLVVLRSAPAQAPAPAPAPDTSWVARSVLYEVFVQDFSPPGNFRGVIDGLDRIQSLGANVIWLMPVHPIGVEGRKGTLGSPYAARDYRAINPSYGTAEDFRALVNAAHALGMKVILDWVPDHTSLDHAWVREHPDYYFRNERGEPSVPRDPGGKLTDWTDVVQLDFGNPAVRRETISTMTWWLTEFGLDGFRVDVAGFIPNDFWREALPALRASVSRRLLLLAEWDDPELHRLGYDLTYGWESYKQLKAVWRGAPASSFVRQALQDQAKLPRGGMRMRFTTNHDETAWDAPPVAIFSRGAGTRAAYVAIALLPGRPLIYNGQEVESPQKLALFEPDSIHWGQPDSAAARAFYRRVLKLASTEPDLISGDLKRVETTAPADLIAYSRGHIVVLVNPRARPILARVKSTNIDGARDLLSSATHRGRSVTLPAHGALVLRRPGK